MSPLVKAVLFGVCALWSLGLAFFAMYSGMETWWVVCDMACALYFAYRAAQNLEGYIRGLRES